MTDVPDALPSEMMIANKDVFDMKFLRKTGSSRSRDDADGENKHEQQVDTEAPGISQG